MRGILLCGAVLLAALFVLPSCHPTCSPASCPSGCCGIDGVCYHGPTNKLCGQGGDLCVDCTSGNGACRLDTATCVVCTQPGASCSNEKPCCGDYNCMNGICQSATCSQTAGSCEGNADCCQPDVCVLEFHQCQRCLGKSTVCTSNNECCSGACQNYAGGGKICR